MSTILRWDRYRAFFYANAGDQPPHVQVRAGDKKTKIWLHDLTVAVNAGFSAGEVEVIIRRLEQHRDELLSAWNERFGAYCGA